MILWALSQGVQTLNPLSFIDYTVLTAIKNFVKCFILLILFKTSTLINET